MESEDVLVLNMSGNQYSFKQLSHTDCISVAEEVCLRSQTFVGFLTKVYHIVRHIVKHIVCLEKAFNPKDIWGLFCIKA